MGVSELQSELGAARAETVAGQHLWAAEPNTPAHPGRRSGASEALPCCRDLEGVSGEGNPGRKGFLLRKPHGLRALGCLC